MFILKNIAFIAMGLIIFSSVALAAAQNNGVPFQQMQDSVDSLQTQVNSISSVVESNDQTDTNQQTQIDENTGKIGSFFGIFTEISATDTEQQNQIDELQTRVSEFGGRIDVLETAASGKRCTINSECDDNNPCTDDSCTGGFCSEISNSYSEACYTGPLSTRSVGECSDGVRTCSGGVFGQCSGQVLPVLESCGDNKDNNCNGTVNEEAAIGCLTFFQDSDADGYGRPSQKCLCAASYPYIALSSGDCNDVNSLINPGTTEKCSTVFDDNCNGQINENGAIGCVNYYFDGDNDNYGISTLSRCSCSSASPYSAINPNDCNDNSAQIKPGVAEVCNNGADDNCNGLVDEGC